MAKMSSNRGMSKKFLISEMDQSVKRMLKLIEEGGDSFAKKAEIYYQKRPELVAHVEEFYRMYKSLAERYENVVVELRRSVPSDLRSQISGISDFGSEPPSTITSPEHRFSRRLSGSRPPGFDVFLRTGGSSIDIGNREADEASTLDYESESEDDEFNNFYSNGSTHGSNKRLRKKIADLEAELKRVNMQQEENNGGSCKSMVKNPSSEIKDYKEELRVAKEKIRVSEEEIGKLKIKLEKYESMAPRPVVSSEESREDVKTSPENQEILELIETVASSGELREKVTKLLKERTKMEDEIEKLGANVAELEGELSLKDDQIDEMNEHMNRLHLEHMELVAGVEKSGRLVEELRCRSRELERKLERQQTVIDEGAKEKREAIRQLCISLEHYRNAYQMLRQDLYEQKKSKPVMAS